MRRFFVDRERIQANEAIIEGKDVKHICTVLRLEPGDELSLFDGEGLEYRARILHCSSRSVKLHILEREENKAESPTALTVGQGLLKARKMDRVVRQLTELGARAFVPVLSQRSIPRLQNEDLSARQGRWQTIVEEALKQCGRFQALEILPLMSYEKFLESFASYDLRFIFTGEHTVNTPQARLPSVQGARGAQKVVALVGPEGGFTGEEVRAALSRGFTCLSLGPRTLRADTAAVVAAALLQHVFGDLGDKFRQDLFT